MIPLQTLTDATALAVVGLNVVMVFVVLFGFIWAFGKISEEPDHDEDELKEPGRRPGV